MRESDAFQRATEAAWPALRNELRLLMRALDAAGATDAQRRPLLRSRGGMLPPVHGWSDFSQLPQPAAEPPELTPAPQGSPAERARSSPTADTHTLDATVHLPQAAEDAALGARSPSRADQGGSPPRQPGSQSPAGTPLAEPLLNATCSGELAEPLPLRAAEAVHLSSWEQGAPPPPPPPPPPGFCAGRAVVPAGFAPHATPGGVEDDAVRLLQRSLHCEGADPTPEPGDNLLEWAAGLQEAWGAEPLLEGSQPPLLQRDWCCPEHARKQRHAPRLAAPPETAPPPPLVAPDDWRDIRPVLWQCCVAHNLRFTLRRIELQILGSLAVRRPQSRRERRFKRCHQGMLLMPAAEVAPGITAAFMYGYVARDPGGQPRAVQLAAAYRDAFSACDPASDPASAERRVAALQLLRPFVARLGAFLHALPGRPEWVGRALGPAHAPPQGSLFTFGAAASLAGIPEGEVHNEELGQGAAVWVVRATNIAPLEPLLFDCEAGEEGLLRPRAVLEVASVLPGVLLSTLEGSRQTVVLWHRDSKRDLSYGEVVTQRLAAHLLLRPVFKPFLERYVVPTVGDDAVSLSTNNLTAVFQQWLDLDPLDPGWRELCLIGDEASGKTAAACYLAGRDWGEHQVLLLPITAIKDWTVESVVERALFEALGIPHGGECPDCRGLGTTVAIEAPPPDSLLELRRGILNESIAEAPPRCPACRGTGKQLGFHRALRKRRLVVIMDGVDQAALSDPRTALDPSAPNGQTMLQRSGLSRDRWPEVRLVATVRSEFLRRHDLNPCHILGRHRVHTSIERQTIEEFDTLLHRVSGKKKVAREIGEIVLKVSWEARPKVLWLQPLDLVAAQQLLQYRIAQEGVEAAALLPTAVGAELCDAAGAAAALLRWLAPHVRTAPQLLLLAAGGLPRLSDICIALGSARPGPVEVHEAWLQTWATSQTEQLRGALPPDGDPPELLVCFSCHVAVWTWRRGRQRFTMRDVRELPRMPRVRDDATLAALCAALPVRREHPTDDTAPCVFAHGTLQKFLVARAALDLSGRGVARSSAAHIRLREVPHPRRSLLHVAAEWDHAVLIRALLVAGVDIDRTDDKGRTALDVAAQGRHVISAGALIAAGAGGTEQVLRDWGGPLLDRASRSGDARSVHFLLAHGAMPNAPTYSGTPLHAAATSGDDATVDALVRAGASTQSGGLDGRTPLALAADSGKVVSGCALVEAERARCVQLSKAGQPPRELSDAVRYQAQQLLLQALQCGDTAAVERLVEAGAGVDLELGKAGLPMHVAARAGHPACLRSLIKHGAELDGKDAKGRTALFHAVAQSHVDAITTLVELGADAGNSKPPPDSFAARRQDEVVATELGRLIREARQQQRLAAPEFKDQKAVLYRKHQSAAAGLKSRSPAPVDACGLLCLHTSRAIAAQRALFTARRNPAVLPPLQADSAPRPSSMPAWATKAHDSPAGETPPAEHALSATPQPKRASGRARTSASHHKAGGEAGSRRQSAAAAESLAMPRASVAKSAA
eukprot:TRINITY_DN10346_c0_g1_i2.p1 TRINITY_DN10346_c0_g1~~TRINITY_DN10346_c0_g1_i2.p1  ORF type:complete len:1541 (+),score=488.47 TRINITY_DN10346_c0_g1_i2:85-4623(+)